MKRWNQYATVRSKARIVVAAYENQEGRYHYPRVKLPICLHPLVMGQGDDVMRFLLTQGCYNFMSEISGIEENIVIHVSSKVLNYSYMPYLPAPMRQVLRSVCVDEYYHSLEGWDYRDQVHELTQLEPLELTEPQASAGSSTLEAMSCLADAISDSEVREFFEINVLCLVENTITSSLLEYSGDKKCHQAFTDLNRLHIQDESRHAGYFRKLLMLAYDNTDLSVQEQVALHLPNFIKQSLDAAKEKRAYARMLLRHIGFEPAATERVIADTYPETHANANFSVVNVAANKNIELLRQFPVFQHDRIKQAFHDNGLAI
ncbi:MAG: diiron oxygenase [Proteobacteria bacterium]|nr:diiron oxygenase [Pseudomonadota bacterium]